MVRRRAPFSRWRCWWSGRLCTWRCAASLSCWCSAGGPRTPRRSRSWSCATSWQSCAASTHGLGFSPKTVRCSQRSAACCPGADGRSSWSRPRRCLDGTAAWCAGTGPTRPCREASHRSPSRYRPLIVRLATETHAGAISASAGSCCGSAAGSPQAPSPGSCAPTASSRRRVGRPHPRRGGRSTPAGSRHPGLRLPHRGHRVPATAVRAVLHSAADPARAAGGRHHPVGFRNSVGALSSEDRASDHPPMALTFLYLMTRRLVGMLRGHWHRPHPGMSAAEGRRSPRLANHRGVPVVSWCLMAMVAPARSGSRFQDHDRRR